jgi:hypothetical protein
LSNLFKHHSFSSSITSVLRGSVSTSLLSTYNTSKNQSY